MKTTCAIGLLCLSGMSAALCAYAQGNAFTYQGSLNDAGSPANGSYDLTFALFDSDSASWRALYSLSGTIGQHDAAGVMSGGSYSLTGGFWSLCAVQSPGAPRLTITLTSTNTVLTSRPSPSTGFALQQNLGLSTSTWTAASEPISDNGTIRFILVNPPTGNRLYRRSKP